MFKIDDYCLVTNNATGSAKKYVGTISKITHVINGSQTHTGQWLLRLENTLPTDPGFWGEEVLNLGQENHITKLEKILYRLDED
jgi:hypothetical protein